MLYSYKCISSTCELIGAFTKITLTLARQVNIEPKLKPGNVLCHQCRTHAH